MRPVDEHIETQLTERLDLIGRALGADVVAVVSPIVPGLEGRLRAALEALPQKQTSVAVILDTLGGVVEVVERMAVALRHAYEDVTVIVPDRAMSAGTIFALSADRIMMDYLSCLALSWASYRQKDLAGGSESEDRESRGRRGSIQIR